MRTASGRFRWLGLAVVVAWSLFPVYWALSTSFMTTEEAESTPVKWFPAHPIIGNYSTILGLGGSNFASGIPRSLVNIAVESIGAMLLTVVIAAPAAYAFARLEFRLKPLFFYGVLFTLVLPIYSTLIPVYQIMSGVRLTNTYIGIILVYTSGFVPLAMWIMYNFFLSLPPGIEEAARIDGASTLQVLRKIALPLAAPGIVATAIVTLLFGWGQFIFPLVLSSSNATEPATVALAALQGRRVVPYTTINAGAMLAMVVPLVLVLVFNRWIVQGIIAGSGK